MEVVQIVTIFYNDREYFFADYATSVDKICRFISHLQQIVIECLIIN